MDFDALQEAYKNKKTIRHLKTGDSSPYVILGIGEMKVEGEWYISCTYMSVKDKKSYTRMVSDFSNFYVKA